MVASQKTDRNAFDLFILVTPLLRASVPYVYRTAADALRFNAGILRRRFRERQAESLRGEPRNLSFSPKKVTELLPEQCADVLPDLEPAASRRARERLWFLAAKLFQ